MTNDKPDLEATLVNCEVLDRKSLAPFKVVFVKINILFRDNLTSEELYDATRWCWRLSERRANNCDYVFGVWRGQLVSIYANTRWERITEKNYIQAPPHNTDPQRNIGTHSFFVCDKASQKQFFTSKLIYKPLNTREIFGNDRNVRAYNYK